MNSLPVKFQYTHTRLPMGTIVRDSQHIFDMMIVSDLIIGLAEIDGENRTYIPCYRGMEIGTENPRTLHVWDDKIVAVIEIGHDMLYHVKDDTNHRISYTTNNARLAVDNASVWDDDINAVHNTGIHISDIAPYHLADIVDLYGNYPTIQQIDSYLEKLYQ